MNTKRVNKSNLKLNFEPQASRREKLSSYVSLEPKCSILPQNINQMKIFTDAQPNTIKLLTGQRYIGGQRSPPSQLNKRIIDIQKGSATTLRGSNYIVKKQTKPKEDGAVVYRTPSSMSLYDHNPTRKQAVEILKSQELQQKSRRSLLSPAQRAEPQQQDKSSIITALVQKNKELRKQNIKKDNLIQRLIDENQTEQNSSGTQSNRYQLTDSQNHNLNLQTQSSQYNEFLPTELQSQINFPRFGSPYQVQQTDTMQLHKQNFSEPVASQQINQVNYKGSFYKHISPPSQRLDMYSTQTDRDDLCFTFSEITQKTEASKKNIQLSGNQQTPLQARVGAKANFKSLPIEFQIFPSQKKFFI